MDRIRPAVSILVPHYNNRSYIGDCLRSLQRQTRQDWEAVVVDDASTDGGIADIIQALGDPRILFFQQPKNAGKGAAMNRAFAESGGPILTLLDADDMLAPDHLQKMLAVFEDKPDTDIVFSDLRLFGAETGRWSYTLRPVEELAQRQWIPAPGSCLRREIWTRTGGHYEGPELRFGNIDWDFWLAAAASGPLNVRHVAEPLCLYRQHAGNISKTRSYNEHITRECMYRRHQAFIDAQGMGASFTGEGYYEAAAASWRKNEGERSLALALRGWELFPPIPPRLRESPLAPAKAAVQAAKLAYALAGRGGDGLTLNQENLDARCSLVEAYLKCGEFDQARSQIEMMLGQVLGGNVTSLIPPLAVQLALVALHLHDSATATEALTMALTVSPDYTPALHLHMDAALRAGKGNKAIALLGKALATSASLKSLMPLLGLIAHALSSTMKAHTLSSRLASIPAPPPSRGQHSSHLIEHLYSTPLGRILHWNWRAPDLCQQEGGCPALQEAVRQVRNAQGSCHRILEIGCGNGRNLALFSRLGLESVGQDISSAALELARQRMLPRVTLTGKPAPVLDYPFHFFDLVVFHRVLQHLTPEELPVMIDTAVRLGRFIYINETLPDDATPESWYLKKYDYRLLMAQRNVALFAELKDAETCALLFGSIFLHESNPDTCPV